MLFKMARTRRPIQLSLARKAGWGGARPGAGRPRKDGQAGPPGVPHLRRPPLDARHPVHVTLKVRREVWSLRSGRSVRALKRALLDVRQRQEQGVAPFAVVHFAILSNHLHLILEAGDREALSRGMQSLEIRMARALNDSMERRGRVFADRYHAHILKTPTEVGRARRYVLLNAAIHEARAGLAASGADGLTSAAMPWFASPARTWLLAHGWRRARPWGAEPAEPRPQRASSPTGTTRLSPRLPPRPDAPDRRC
jgi:putative transposase